MSAHLALGAAAALAGLAAISKRRGEQTDEHHLLDLPYDMHEIVTEGLYTIGVDVDEAERLIESNPVAPIKMQSMNQVWPKIRKSFPGVDHRGAPADLWRESRWDHRGPPHVVQLHQFLLLLLPTHADRRDPGRIRDRLLAGDVERRWGQDLLARTWEDADRDMQAVVGLRRRSAPTPARIGTIEGIFNVPPAIFAEGDFLDGRHRLFAARLAGLSHFPIIDLADLARPRAAPRAPGSSNLNGRQLHHGGPALVRAPKPGTFFSSSMKSAVDYARYGPNQSRRTPQRGVVSTVVLSPDANVERFDSFQSAYDAYQVSSSMSLARKAVVQGRADVVQIYDEHIIVNPEKVTFLRSMTVEPS